MKFTVIAEAPVPGVHRATLVGISEITGAYAKPALRFDFETADGKAISRVVGVELKVGTAFGDLTAELLGCPELPVGESVDLGAVVGRTYDIFVVSKGENGVSIQSVKPVAQNA